MQILLLLFSICTINLSKGRTKLRVIGGQDATLGELHYVVRIEIHDLAANVSPFQHHCTGSVLSSTWTLTARHCISAIEKLMSKLHYVPKIVIRHVVTPASPSAATTISDILSFIKHPAYRLTTLLPHNDIGLLQTRSIIIPQYAKISALDYSSLVGEEMVVAGYGITNSSGGGLFLKEALQILNVTAVSCTELHKEFKAVPALCIARRCGESASLYPGDSGGPTLHPSGIVGITSGGQGYDATVKPDRYRSHIVAILVPVSPYIDWISSHVNIPGVP